MFFGINGICIKSVTEFPDTREMMYVYPGFRMVDGKWLSNKWTVQMHKGGDITSGFVVFLESREIEHYWLPQKIILQL